MSRTLALFVEIARISDGAQVATNSVRTRLAARIESFRALLDDNCRRRISVESYARAMRVTPGQLTRLSRQALGHVGP
jgi:AraC family transcriptional regulator, transcriptional activator of pobA